MFRDLQLPPENNMGHDKLTKLVIEPITFIDPVVPKKDEPLAGTIVRELVGIQEVRSGKYPPDRTLETLAEIARSCIETEKPLPILVPMGPKKPDPNLSVDLAEVFALKQLAALNTRLMANYSLGAIFYIRQQDLMSLIIESGVPNLEACMERYTTDFNQLIKVLGFGSFIHTFKESDLANIKEYSASVDILEPLFARFIAESEGNEDPESVMMLPSWNALAQYGWRGVILTEHRNYYRQRFHSQYPDRNGEEIEFMLSRYFAASLTSPRLKANCLPEINDLKFQLSFGGPVPGTPRRAVESRVYWRTVPRSLASHGPPFWRTKGCFIKGENGDVRLKMISFHDPSAVFEENRVRLQKNGDWVDIRADYLVTKSRANLDDVVS